ncbi:MULTISPECIES: DUF4129 domain-containing protein [Sphingobacterium]|uniref:DUF4129 domain-containing protein n=1 Tax=Sphingobacterium TaxID=28453 RepID=UPI0013DC2856|nr:MULTISPECIES: DUF4129 domain-containing protein [unclassified Sphingobacterium]
MSSVIFQENLVDTVQSLQDEPIYQYWKAGYYDSIPRAKIVTSDSIEAFDVVVGRYQAKEFEYIESISDKLSFFDKLLDRISKILSDLFPQPKGDFNEGVFNLLAVIGAVVLIFLIYKFFVSRKKLYVHHDTDVENEEEQIAFVERNLLQVDVQAYLSDALQQKNYTLAIRYLQLLNIQLLGRKGIVQWNQSKTNTELMEEVNNEELRQDFLACAVVFDYAWFGHFEITEDAYQKYAPRFIQFQRRWS